MDRNVRSLTDVGSSTVPTKPRPSIKAWGAAISALGIVAAVVVFGPRILTPSPGPAAAPQPPVVSVSLPLQRNIDTRLEFLGQFAAVQQVDFRPQVGGILEQIGFRDGDIVHKGDLLFQIDPTPYLIKLSEATAQLESARARLDLADRQLRRFSTLSQSGAGAIESTDQAVGEQGAAQAAVDDAQAQIRDAQFDLNRTRITAPFTGRIGSHLVSVGNLISGSRAGDGPTTVLATIVSIGPIYFNFDMSESDYETFLKDRQNQNQPLAEKVQLSLGDGTGITREGTLDFIDNTIDRASSTIHARATVPDADLTLTPGGFARILVEVAPPKPTLLLPDDAVLPDQTQFIVLTVSPDDVVTPKIVQIGDLRGGLRVITSGLAPTDKVIIDGIPVANPGAKVSPKSGAIHFGSDQIQD
jgi:RND family efflux transporter MFP subunit